MALRDTYQQWHMGNFRAISEVIEIPSERHPALYVHYLFSRLIESARNGNGKSIDILCNFLVEDPRIPFGRIIKKHIARLFKQHPLLLSADQKRILIQYTEKLILLPYPPRELHEFKKMCNIIITAQPLASADGVPPPAKP